MTTAPRKHPGAVRDIASERRVGNGQQVGVDPGLSRGRVEPRVFHHHGSRHDSVTQHPASPSSARPARSTCSCPPTTSPSPTSRAPQVRLFHPAAAQGAPGSPVAGPAEQRTPGRLHRPLPLLLLGSEGDGPRQLLQDPQRHAGRRAPLGPAAPGRRGRPHHPPPLGRDRLRLPGPDVRPLPEEGHHRPGRRRRHRHLRPGCRADPLRRDPPHERRLLGVRGQTHHRPGRDRALAR